MLNPISFFRDVIDGIREFKTEKETRMFNSMLFTPFLAPVFDTNDPFLRIAARLIGIGQIVVGILLLWNTIKALNAADNFTKKVGLTILAVIFAGIALAGIIDVINANTMGKSIWVLLIRYVVAFF